MSSLSFIKMANNNQTNIIIKTVSDYKDLKQFYQVPFEVYKDNKFWIPPFYKEFKDFFNPKNIFWTHAEYKLFIVLKDDKIAGRIGAIIDHKYCENVNQKIGYFGFFECINDYNCADLLFQSAQDWLLSKNIEIMRGPIDGRIDITCGFLTEGFNSSPSLLSNYNPEYYISFTEKFQMRKVRDFITYYIDLTKPFSQNLKNNAKECEGSGISIRSFNRLRTQKELKWWVKFFLESFEDHWGYVPVSEKEVKSRFGVKQLRWVVDTKLFLIAEDKGMPVAYIWATPDFNQVFKKMNGRLGPFQLLRFLFDKKQINRGKLHFIGIKKNLRSKGIGSLLNYKALYEMKKRGYVCAEVGFIDEKNAVAHSTIAKTGAKPYKRYRIFEKIIK